MNNRIYKKLSDKQIKKINEMTKASVEAKKRYRKKTKQVAIEFNTETEADLLEHLLKQPNKQGYIKNLIRENLENN